jgi:hypothetical protein
MGRLSLGKGEGESEGSRLSTQLLDKSNPSPPAYAKLRRGRQSSPLVKGRGDKSTLRELILILIDLQMMSLAAERNISDYFLKRQCR